MTDIDLDVPDELRSCLVDAAKHFGLSEHDFILKAIAEKLDRGDCEAGTSDSVDVAKAISESRGGISGGGVDTGDIVADGRR